MWWLRMEYVLRMQVCMYRNMIQLFRVLHLINDPMCGILVKTRELILIPLLQWHLQMVPWMLWRAVLLFQIETAR